MLTAGQDTDDNIIRRMRFACWMSTATGTHLEYVILIPFPRQQWERERASLLRLYVTLPVLFNLDMAGCCEHGNEPRVSIKCRRCLD